MTELEWFDCADPTQMLFFLNGNSGEALWKFCESLIGKRKIRLYSCAALRRVEHLMADERSRRAVQMLECLAEGRATEKDAQSCTEQLKQVIYVNVANFTSVTSKAHYEATRAVYTALSSIADPWTGAYAVADAPGIAIEHVSGIIAREAEDERQANLLRDIFGNPFRPVAFDPAWRTPTVSAVAQSIYAERRFADLPILADALEEAGCTSADLLAHLRSGGDHVRGCWALDLVLAKD